ncbi:MAG: homocysteine S-methyltransferase family protein [Lachnospiraceae bacterium]|nr:homocysteine S-methyltransferase family protein [Lachnospiraceae bacterium]
MKKDLRERLGKEWLVFDGGTGSILQSKGLKGGELPETWNLKRPEDIIDLHCGYLRAGCDIFNTNTFGANALKFPDNLEEIVTAAVENAKEARRRTGREDAYVALDIGPTGKLLEPLGDLPFEKAVELFGEVVRYGSRAGADLVLIETMSDSYEAKAAVLAAKENCDLPVCITVTFDEKGKLLTGGSVDSTVALLEGLRVDALGVNCGLGPEQMIPIVKRLTEVCSVPVIVNPNAGLPRTEGGRTVYNVGPEEFAGWMEKIAEMGVQAVGGCCGTTPEHIRLTAERVRKLPFKAQTRKNRTVVSSFSQCVEIGPRPVIIGERINPTGKKKFKQALRDGDIEYILREGLRQEDSGAHILDVNVGLPEIDEPAMMTNVVQKLQSVLALPLQIDTTDAEALERGMRIYNGKPMVNSVNGKEESIETVFPLVRKYGGVLVALVLDEDGIPSDAEGRIRIAKRIYEAADRYGVPREDIVIDGLAMTISSDNKSAVVTLETLRRVRDELQGHTILGVSNISFGLPRRALINSHFLTMALQSGLSAAIMNPGNEEMMESYRAYLALAGLDPQCMGFIEAYAGTQDRVPAARAAGGTTGAADGTAGSATAVGTGAGAEGASPGRTGEGAGRASAASSSAMGLTESVVRGMAQSAAEAARKALAHTAALDLINGELIPALDQVGKGFEKGTVFLPQLLMSAEAAKAAFEVVKESLQGQSQEVKGKIILATVKGDIHDIGKNIVKVMLENYGYDVIDLGKDVAPEVIVEAAIRENIALVGLSALMTTTVVSMEETIRLLHEKKPDTKVVVGGAVMTQEYADAIHADCYAKDAMATVHFAEEVFGG